MATVGEYMSASLTRIEPPISVRAPLASIRRECEPNGAICVPTVSTTCGVNQLRLEEVRRYPHVGPMATDNLAYLADGPHPGVRTSCGGHVNHQVPAKTAKPAPGLWMKDFKAHRVKSSRELSSSTRTRRGGSGLPLSGEGRWG